MNWVACRHSALNQSRGMLLLYGAVGLFQLCLEMVPPLVVKCAGRKCARRRVTQCLANAKVRPDNNCSPCCAHECLPPDAVAMMHDAAGLVCNSSGPCPSARLPVCPQAHPHPLLATTHLPITAFGRPWLVRCLCSRGSWHQRYCLMIFGTGTWSRQGAAP
jgi:hypothetical protein